MSRHLHKTIVVFQADYKAHIDEICDDVFLGLYFLFLMGNQLDTTKKTVRTVEFVRCVLYEFRILAVTNNWFRNEHVH